MKKTIIAVSMLLGAIAATPAHAAFVINNNNVAVSIADNAGNDEVAVLWLDPKTSAPRVTFSNNSATCNTGDQRVSTVNGTPIKFVKEQQAADICYYVPLSEQGRNFVFNEFKTKNVVTWGTKVISAENFINALNELKTYKNAF